MPKSLYIKSEQRQITLTDSEYSSILSAKSSNPSGQFNVKGSYYDLKDLFPKNEEDSIDDVTVFSIKGRITDARGIWDYFIKHFNCGIIFKPEDVSIKNNRYYILSMRQRLELLSFHEKYYLARNWKDQKEVKLREEYFTNPFFMNSDNHVFDTGEYVPGTYGIVVMNRLDYEKKMAEEKLVYGEFYD